VKVMVQRLVVDSADWTLVERSYTKLNAHTARPITVLCVCVCVKDLSLGMVFGSAALSCPW
jgi:hypothetical protein